MREKQQSPEKNVAEQLLKEYGVEKIEEKDGITYFHFTRPLYSDVNGKLILDTENKTGIAMLQTLINKYFGFSGNKNYFRSVETGKEFSALGDIVEDGTDIPDYSVEEPQEVNLTDYLDKASEYGERNFTSKIEPILNSRIIMIYDGEGVTSVDNDRKDFANHFTKEPKELLKGIILVYCEADKENELVDIGK